MNILHQLKQHNALMPIGDLIEWIGSDEGKDFSQAFFDGYPAKFESWHVGIWFLVRILINKELRHPLELSDFVKPNEPDKIDFVIDESKEKTQKGNFAFLGESDYPGMDFLYRNKDYEKALSQWENWDPIFDGWEITMNDDDLGIGLTKSGVQSLRIVFHPDDNMGNTILLDTGEGVVRDATRENLMDLFKRHDIEL